MTGEFGANLFNGTVFLGTVYGTTSLFRLLPRTATLCLRLLAWNEHPQLPRSFLFYLD